MADLVVGSELRFRDLGEKSLKGVPGKWPIKVVANSENRDRRETVRDGFGPGQSSTE